jgi:hypothetical protein
LSSTKFGDGINGEEAFNSLKQGVRKWFILVMGILVFGGQASLMQTQLLVVDPLKTQANRFL